MTGQATSIGASPLRKEDRPLLTGAASFVDDLHRPGMVHATVLRSPHAHARIASIDTAQALAHPGVVDVVTGADVPDVARIPMRLYPLPGMERFLQPVLADGVVRYSGEPVAVVVATSRYVAEDAAELIRVEYDPLETVVDAERALEDGAPALHPSAGTNLAGEMTIAFGEIDAAFAAADVVVQERILCQRHAAVPMETRGLLAEYSGATRELVVWGPTKVVHVNRWILSRLLGMPEERLRMVEPHVGGGFGARGEFYPEDFLIPFCALRVQRPVAWTEDREENLRSTNHSREQVHEIALALAADGTFLGLRDRLTHDTGAYIRTHGSTVPGMAAGLLPGPYLWGAYQCEMRQVVTNKTPAGTYRAPGRYEANLARERMIDIAARRLGRDPVQLRRQNLVPPDRIPYRTGTHTDGHPVVYDSADFPLLLDKAVDAFDYESVLRWRDAAPDPTRRRGVGVAFFVEKSGIGRWEYARIGVTSEGGVDVYSGTASLGQGVETVLAQVCADHLGVDYEHVTVHHGDTALIPYGMGAFGSRASSLGGEAVLRAAAGLRAKLLDLAAEHLEAAAEDLRIAGDRVVVVGSETAGVSLAELFEAAQPVVATGGDRTPGLDESAFARSDDMSFPYGMHCVTVEVDVAIGHVDIDRYLVAYDVGKAINPRLVEGQIIGGVAQGVGGALLEHLAYDASGQLTAGSFMDYLLPTAGECPNVEVLVTEDAPSPLNSLGAKGAGEGGTSAAGAAIANAVSDALRAEVTALPITPERVIQLAEPVRSPA